MRDSKANEETEDKEHNITYIFERYDFKDLTMFNSLLMSIQNNNIKLFKCRLHMIKKFRVPFDGERDSSFTLAQSDVFDQDGETSIIAMKRLVNGLTESSFNPLKIFIKNYRKMKNVKIWDFLALGWKKINLYKYILKSLRENINALNQSTEGISQIKILYQNVIINLPQTNRQLTPDMMKGLIHTYKQIIKKYFN